MGAYPPPYGGITSHVKRLDWFCRQQGISSVVLDSSGDNHKAVPRGAQVIPLHGHRIQKLWKLMRYLMREKADIVHFHLSGLSNFIWGAVPLLFAAQPSKCLASLHSGSFISSCESLPRSAHIYTRFVFRRFAHLLAANPEQRDYLVKQMHIAPERISIIPAFLPIIAEPFSNGMDLLPDPLLEFFGKYVYIALISGFVRPYYGFHTAIQAFDLLEDLSIGLVIKCYTTGDEDYASQIRKKVKERRNVYVCEEMNEEQMPVLLKRVNIFIRGTSKDGDSVALREAAVRQTRTTGWAPGSGAANVLGGQRPVRTRRKSGKQRLPSKPL